MKTAPSLFCSLLVFLGLTGSALSQLLWDGDLVTPGAQNGNGAWNLTAESWFNGTNSVIWDNSGSAIAAFGVDTSRTGGTVTVSGTVKVGGMRFNTLSPSSGVDLPVTSAYTLTGGTIEFANNAVIEVANNSTSGSSGVLFVNFNSVLVGNGLTIKRVDEPRINAFQYVRFQVANPNLTGVLNLNAISPTNGIFMLTSTASTISSMERVVVQSGSVLAAGGTGNTYNIPMTLAGNGQGSGALRVDSSNMRFSGAITLTEDTLVQTNRNIVNTVIDAPITDGGGGFMFQRFASTANSVLTLQGTSNYTGITSFGRSGTVSGGINILDFTASTAPVADMLYNGVENAGGLQLIGGSAAPTYVTLQGKNYTENSQRFGNVEVSGTRSNLILNAGGSGEMKLSLGNITRAGTGSVAFMTDRPGSITTTTPDGFLGPWAAFVNKDGYGAWANVENGVLTEFKGGVAYVTGTTLSSMGAATDVSIRDDSVGNITGGTGTYQVNTLSMIDSTANRVVDIGSGNVLRLGTTGGIQLTADAMSLDIGIAGNAGALRAGTGTGSLWLTNLSKTGILTINSVIENNGTSVLTLFSNGQGKTILAGANTFTGATQVGSGELEVAHSTGLGTGTAATTVLSDATLRLAGNISLAKPITLNGLGVKGMGALVNTSGQNEITQLVTVSQSARINSESGTLTFKAADGVTVAINSSGTGATSFFGGNGDILIQGRLNAGANAITKDGGGTLTFAGSQNFTAAITPTSGTVHLDFSSSYSPASNILYNGVTAAALSLNNSTLKLTGKSGATNSQVLGALTLSNYANINLNGNGATSLTLTMGAVTKNFGALLGLDLGTGSTLRVNTGSDNAMLAYNNRPYAFIRDSVNGDEWAATGVISGGTRPVVKLSATTAGYTPSNATVLSGNVNFTAGIPSTVLGAEATTTSLRFAAAQTSTISDGGNGLTLTTGGILVSSTVGDHITTINVGTLRPSPSTVANINPELVIVQNNVAAPLVISSAIPNTVYSTNVAAPTTVTKTGPGLVVLNGAHGYSGSTRVYEGAIQFGGTVNSGMEFLIGSGANSAKVILGLQDSTFTTSSVDYIQAVGTGTDNRIVGGSAGMSRLTLTGGTSTFATGFIGGPGLYENNLEFRLASITGSVTLGPDNTYIGRTTLSRGLIVVEKLANIGEASSLGTGSFNAAAATIVLSDATTSALDSPAVSIIRYVGDTDSVTNRPVQIANSDASTDISSVVGVLENNGKGTVKFTAPFAVGGTNIVDRVLRLSGTNEGLNEIVSIGDTSATIITRLEKEGTGTWALMGSSTYTGTTTVSGGTLLANNPLTGSATGLGDVNVSENGRLGGIGRIAPGEGKSVTISGGILSPGIPGVMSEVNRLTIDTLGAGMLAFDSGASLFMDLFTGAGMGDNTSLSSASDQLVVSGRISLGDDTTLRILNPNSMTTWAVNDQWQLFDWTGLTEPITGSFGSYDLPSLPEGLVWNVDFLYTTGVLSITFVPEPSRVLLLALALLGFIMRRRR